MTLTIELSPELEQRLQAEAQAHSQDVQAFVLSVLERSAPGPLTAKTPRQRAALGGYGKFAGCGFTADDIARNRREEAEREMQAATRHPQGQQHEQAAREQAA